MDERQPNEVTVSELVITLCDKIKSAVNVADMIMTLTNCNNCGKQPTCEFIPAEGETVRLNCPLWEEPKQAQEELDLDNPVNDQMSIDDISPEL